MNAPKQKYTIYRDQELIVSELPSLAATSRFAMKDARKEHAHGRAANYKISGSQGFSREGTHYKGRLRWEAGKLKVGMHPGSGACV